MPDASDMELLRDYARQGSGEAFAELVRRHVNLVYSVAFRHVGVAAHAEEITQAVFVILARKAAGLRPATILDAWFYQTARLTSLSFLRGERRRQSREQEACMQSAFQESGEPPVWNQLAPLLDEAMARLGKTDREAVVLRFFKGKSLNEVAAALEITEAAAQSRVHRAVDKLQKYFLQRGIDSTTAAITGAISANSVQAAPVALAKTATAVALAKGATASTSTLTLIKGALKIMAWTKAKTAILSSVVVLLAAGTTTVTVKEIQKHDLNAQWDIGKADSRLLARLPHIVRIVPTKFPNGGSMAINNSRSIGFAVDVREMLQTVYGGFYNHTIFLTPMPPGHYDFIANLPSGSSEALGKEIQKQLGIVGRVEAVETNVLFLKVSQPGAAGLLPGKIRNGSASISFLGGNVIATNMPAGNIAMSFERLCKMPVIDQTGLKGRYDFDLKLDSQSDPQLTNFKQALRNQLGLELVPGTAPVKFLFIEKAK